jgi:hypothetical protein
MSKNRFSFLWLCLPLMLCLSVQAQSIPAARIATVPPAAPSLVNGAWSEVLKAGHPRLLGPRRHLRTLAQDKAQMYNEIKSADSVRDSIFAAGIAHAVEPKVLSREQIAPYIETAMRHTQRGPTNVHQDSWIWMQDVVLAYDFFYSELTAEQRQAMIGWLNQQLDSFKDDENAFHNSIMPKILTYLRIAYATWGENPQAQAFRDYAINKLYQDRVLPVLQTFGAGGGTTEAGWYARGALWYLIQALELARRVEGYDGFARASQFFYQRLAYEMFQSYPGQWIYGSERYPVEGDGSYLYGGHSEAGRHTRMILAQYFRGTELSRYAANLLRRGKASNSPARLVNFLFQEPSDEPLPLETFPLAHLTHGIGGVYARGDWGDDATWFRFNCGDYFTGHQHLDVGNFEIFRREPLATESGEYIDYSSNHSINYLMRTVAHNSMLIYQPDEKFPLRGTFRDGGRVAYANDGGQTKTWEWPVQSLEAWNARRQEFERGDIVAYENQPNFMFVAADCTRAYNPSKLKSWIRQIVFLRPHTFVIMDRVISTRPEYEKTWLLHSKNQPAQNGPTSAILNSTSKFTVQTLLPQRAQRRAVQGYTYRGQTFPETASGQTPEAPQWRLEVSPATAQTEDVFLHVLSTEDQPVVAKLIEEAGATGVQIGTTKVLLKGQTGGTISINGVQHTLAATIKTGKFE